MEDLTPTVRWSNRSDRQPVQVEVIAMTLREHPLLSRVLEAADGYRAGTLTTERLQSVLSGMMSAMESDVPKPVRDALFQTEARIDSARFAIDTTDQPKEIASILDEFESTLRTVDADR